MDYIFKNKIDCFGCSACADICPKNAIKMVADEQGFLYPQMEKELCINCGLCVDSCQIGKKKQLTKSISKECFGIKHVDSIRHESSLGGVFTAISEIILEEKGVCCGVVFNEDFEVEHALATTEQQRNLFRGSKYVQSKTIGIYKSVGDLLKQERKVLFTGTPCQVGSLKAYLKTKRIKADNLFTIDMVCHGVPSPLVWKHYVSFLEKKYGAKLISYKFRNKNSGWRGYHIEAIFENGLIKLDNHVTRTFVNLFSDDLIIRPSCFHCPYASTDRCGDITIGDFWGIEKIDASFSDNKGISMVFVNTDKGNALFEKLNMKELEMKTYASKLIKQPNLYNSTNYGREYGRFWKDYCNKGFKYVARKYAGYGVPRKIYRYKRAIIERLRRV